jgi:hypothetical protein
MYPTIDHALGSLEPDDAHDDNLHVFDSEGRRLRIVLGADGRSISLIEMEKHPDHVRNLTCLLREFLSAAGVDEQWTTQASLNDLVSKATKECPAEY